MVKFFLTVGLVIILLIDFSSSSLMVLKDKDKPIACKTVSECPTGKCEEFSTACYKDQCTCMFNQDPGEDCFDKTACSECSTKLGVVDCVIINTAKKNGPKTCACRDCVARNECQKGNYDCQNGRCKYLGSGKK